MSTQPPNTNWTLISHARHLPADHTVRRRVLEEITRHYHAPVRAMMRAWGLRDEHELDDAVQDFFLKFLEKNWLDLISRERGRFRGFLRVSVNHFLLDRKKAGKPPLVPLPDDDMMPSRRTRTPEQIFDQAWGRQLLSESVESFRAECAARSLPHYWTVFDRHVLTDSFHTPSLRETAALLGVGEREAANYLYRARRLFSDLMLEAIRQTVNGGERDVRAELEHLRRCVF